MNVLQIGSDRSKRGILVPGTQASRRQTLYGQCFGRLTIIGFSRASDGFEEYEPGFGTHVIPTQSHSRFLYGRDALRIAKDLPRPDVVSVQDPFETGLAGFLIARRFGVPLHVQVHTDFLSRGYFSYSLANKLRVLIAWFVLRRANRVRVVSRRIEGSLGRFGVTAPISILPIFVDVDRFRAATPGPVLSERFAKFSHRLLFLGRLEREKGPLRALEAFASAAPETACLIVVGEGSERTLLTDRAQVLGVATRVFFEGEHDAAAYIALADLALVPSEYEGYGMVIVEALAAGKPVLATDVGVAREAGAIVTKPEEYAHALAHWFGGGERLGTLKNYPYKSLEGYVDAYCADIAAIAVSGQ